MANTLSSASITDGVAISDIAGSSTATVSYVVFS